MIGAAAAVLIFARLGRIHGPTARLYLTTSRARGVMPGTEVWLDGVKVGAVQSIEFRPPTTDTANRLLIALDVIEDARGRIRRDSRAEIRTGASQLGSPVVELTGGNPNTASVANGDTLAIHAALPLAGARDQLDVVAQSLPVVLDNISAVRDQLFSRTGTIGAFANETDARPLRLLRGETVRLARDTAHQHGTLALLMKGGFSDRAQHVLARADTLTHTHSAATATLAGTNGQLASTLTDAHRQLTQLTAQMAASKPPSASDSADVASLRYQIGISRVQVRALIADIARHPLRYVNF